MLASAASGGPPGSAAGAIGIAYLLGVIFDRFADTLLERINRWNRLLFAIELKKENFETAIYPVESHGFVQPTSWLDEYRRIFKLFERTLK